MGYRCTLVAFVFSTFTFAKVVRSFAVYLHVVTRDETRGFTLRGYKDGVCGGAPVPPPSIVAPFPVWRSEDYTS